jgi:hypothetical protein
MENCEQEISSRKTGDSALIPAASLRELLERAGLRIRGARADCGHCQGHSRLTVSFTDEVAFCHRCKWTGNVRTLSRELGLPVAQLTREIRKKHDHDERFAEWGNVSYLILARYWGLLTQSAEFAKRTLQRCPAEGLAWDALADFYNNEALFGAAFEFLSCEKLPEYLEQPVTRERLVAAFDEACPGWE